MDGIELLKSIKAKAPETEVIMITGHGDMDLAIESLKYDASDFITKPINNDVLEVSLDRARERFGMKRQLRDYTDNLERLVEEKTSRIIELERQNAACQVVTGLSDALSTPHRKSKPVPVCSMNCPVLFPFIIVISKSSLIIPCLRSVSATMSGPTVSIFILIATVRETPVRYSLLFRPAKGSGAGKFLGRDGEEIPVTVYTAPLPNKDGEIELVLDISVDMSELSRLKDELLTTQYKYQRLFDEAPCYISVQNPDLSISEVNRLFKRDFGEGVDNFCYDSYKHRNEPCSDCPVHKTLLDGKSRQRETVVTTLSGEQKNVLVWSAPIRDASGKIVQAMELSTDITEIRRLQDHLTSLGIMLGSMSHGVKGMLTSLDGGIYRLESGLKKGDEKRVQDATRVLKSMIGRVKKMVLDILYYAKSRELETETVDAAAFLRETVEITVPKAKAAGVEFVCTIPDDLGKLQADTGAVSAALVNFLENGVDACEGRGVDGGGRLEFTAERDERGLVITVADNGMGMDRETREKIFTLFFSSKGKRGTGIGLFISNQTIELHGGSIDVDSSPDKGSRFTIVLPEKLH